MRHTRYRQLERLILGADPEKLANPRRPRVDITVPVQWAGRGHWSASTAQVTAIIAKAAMLGGSVQAQAKNGDWHRIYRYMTKRGVRYGCNLATGEWFEVQALREVL